MNRTKNAGLLFFSIVIFYLLGNGLLVVFKEYIKNFSIYSLILVSQGLILTPVIIFLIVTKSNPIRLIPYKKIKISNLILVIICTYLMIPLMMTINAISQLFSQNVMGQTLDGVLGSPFWINYIFIAMVPAIFEEFTFRGVMYHTMRKGSVKYAIILSGIMFGIVHLNINQFCYTVFLGIFFAFLVEGTGSMFSSIIAHLVVNGNSVILLTLLNKLTTRFDQLGISMEDLAKESGNSLSASQNISILQVLIGIGFWGVISLGSTVLAVLLFIAICKRCNRWDHIKSIFSIEKSEKMVTIPFIFATIIGALVMVVTEVLRI